MHSDLSITQNRNKRMIIAIMGLVMGMVGLAYTGSIVPVILSGDWIWWHNTAIT